MKRIQIGNKEVKLPLFAEEMILYRVNPKNDTRKSLKLINEYSKINTQKSLGFLYTNNENSDREIKETIH